MTLTELARRIGTSVSTVSKAFSGSREISDGVRDRIFNEAKRVGCFEKYYKGPRERRIIAVLIPECESEFYGIQLGILEKEIARRGADTVVGITRFDPSREERLFSELSYRMKVDGIVLLGSGARIKNPDEIPLVIVGGNGGNLNADYIKGDAKESMFELVRVMKEYGHKKIGFIGEGLTGSRLSFFKQAMRAHGLPVSEKYIAVSKTKRFAEAGEETMQRIIDSGDLPTVIVAAYDQIAYGAMNRALKCGLRVPDDISFAGSDDISVTQYLGVPLTSIRKEMENVCEQIIDLVFKRIENKHYRKRREIVIPSKICIRESLKNLKESKE